MFLLHTELHHIKQFYTSLIQHLKHQRPQTTNIQYTTSNTNDNREGYSSIDCNDVNRIIALDITNGCVSCLEINSVACYVHKIYHY